MNCSLDHKVMIQELRDKGINVTTRCPECDVVLISKVIPRSEERQLWIDKYGDKNDI